MSSWSAPGTDRSWAGGAALVCLPTAGNGECEFDRWPDTVGPWRVLRPRSTRTRAAAAAHRSVRPDRAAEIAADLVRRGIARVALFGHEGGALLAYRVAVDLERRGAPALVRLFVSGSPAPQHLDPYAPAPSHDELAERVLRATVALGGNPLPSVVAAGVLAIRAEWAALRAGPPPAPVPLRCPITVICWWGEDQDIEPAALAGWSAYGRTDPVDLPGSRMSYATEPARLLRVIDARAATPGG